MKGLKFSFSRFWPSFDPFLAEQVRSLGFLEGFRWIRGSALVGKPGFGRVLSSVFLDLGLGLAHFWLNGFEVRAFRSGLNGLEVRFWFDPTLIYLLLTSITYFFSVFCYKTV